MVRYTIDRFEDEYAICEDTKQNMAKLNRKDLPPNAKEGDVILVQGARITIDEEETQKREQIIKKLADELWS